MEPVAGFHSRHTRRCGAECHPADLKTSGYFTFTTPPQSAAVLSQLSAYALNFSMDTDAPKIFATSGAYSESAWSFMTPPHETNRGEFNQRGAKLMV